MDLLYKRYASPFSYLQSCIDIGMLPEGIDEVMKQDNEEKMWELYLHSNKYFAPQNSFNEFKASVEQTQKVERGMTENELVTAKEKAESILNKLNTSKAGD